MCAFAVERFACQGTSGSPPAREKKSGIGQDARPYDVASSEKPEGTPRAVRMTEEASEPPTAALALSVALEPSAVRPMIIG